MAGGCNDEWLADRAKRPCNITISREPLHEPARPSRKLLESHWRLRHDGGALRPSHPSKRRMRAHRSRHRTWRGRHSRRRWSCRSISSARAGALRAMRHRGQRHLLRRGASAIGAASTRASSMTACSSSTSKPTCTSSDSGRASASTPNGYQIHGNSNHGRQYRLADAGLQSRGHRRHAPVRAVVRAAPVQRQARGEVRSARRRRRVHHQPRAAAIS